MLKPLLTFLSFIVLFGGPATSQEDREPVFLIPSIQKLHTQNRLYNYDSLRRIIAQLDPDIIAVEIRPEDATRDSVYLRKNYSYEMWMMRFWFPTRKVIGYDWLGNELAGQRIPDNYWNDSSSIRKWESALANDNEYAAKIAACNTILGVRRSILSTSTLSQLLKSADTTLWKRYDVCLQESLAGSVHQRITDYYSGRRNEMVRNVRLIMDANVDKRIVIVSCVDNRLAFTEKLTLRPVYPLR